MFSIDWSTYMDPTYWFEGIITKPGSVLKTSTIEVNSGTYWFFINLFAISIIVGILLKLFTSFINPDNPLAKKTPIFADNIIWMGILGYVWFLSNQLTIAFLGARFWILLIGCWFLVLLFFTIKYLIRFFPLEMRYYKKTIINK